MNEVEEDAIDGMQEGSYKNQIFVGQSYRKRMQRKLDVRWNNPQDFIFKRQ